MGQSFAGTNRRCLSAPMATPPPVPPNDGESHDSSVSWFHKTVTLRDWWLVKSDAGAQGKRLAVAGFSFSENKARRFFRSAPIAKRFDEFALETEDRVVVVLQGLVNEARTIENGFSSEIIDRFLFGFPSCWEEHTDDCFEKVVDPGPAANHDRDAVGLNESTTDPGFIIITHQVSIEVAITDSACPTFVPSKPKGTNQDVTMAVADDSNLNKSTPDESESVQDDGYILNRGDDGLEVLPILHDINISRPLDCSSTGAATGTEIQVFLKDIDFPQFTSCHSNAANLSKDTVMLPTEPSSKIIGESSRKTVHRDKITKRKQSSDQNSNTKQSADAHGIALCDSLLDQHLSLRDCAIDYPNIPGSESITATGISKGVSIRKTREVNETNEDEITIETSLPEDPKGVMCRIDDLLGSSSNGNMCILEQMSNSKKDAMTVDTTKSGLEVDASCTSNMKGGNLVSSDPKCGKRECAKDLKDGKVQKLRLRSPPAGKSNPVKQNAVNGTSVVAGSAASAHEKVTRKVVTRSGLRNLKDGKTQHLSSEVLMNQKDKKSLSEPKKRPSHGKHKSDSSTSQSSPTEVNVMEAMLRAGRTLRRSSTHSKSQDKNVQAVNKGSSAKKKAKRKIEFDVDVNVTPKKHMREKKISVHSADSLTFKRSRSGRLLLPTLQFWRNQIPVYDAERNFTGILDEVDA